MKAAMLTREEIQQARSLDLLTYLRCYEPEELVALHSGEYSTRSHDSLKISHGKWYQFSTGIGGVSALDYLVKVRGMPFVGAVKLLNGQDAIKRPASFVAKANPTTTPDKTPLRLLLPEKASDSRLITGYLRNRKIDSEIISYCISHNLIYESLPYHSLIFIGRDEMGTPRYAAYRSITGKRILGDCAGSTKDYSFRITEGTSHPTLHLFEGGIDLLSYATLVKSKGDDWLSHDYISMAGVYAPTSAIIPKSLTRYLDTHSPCEIQIHFDNDTPGRDSSRALAKALQSAFAVKEVPPPFGKDFNDYLCKINKERSIINER